jgi:hypothetical protein
MITSFEREEAAPPAVVEQPSREVAVQNQWAGGQVQGEVDSSDIRLPRINLAQKSGKLGEDFQPGTFTFNKEVVIGDTENAFTFVALGIRKQYQEDLQYDPDGPTPKTFNTAAEVRQAGGQVSDYDGDGYYREIAHVLCLLEAPKGLSEEQQEFFIYEFEGNRYALAMWTVSGSSYTSVAKTIFSAAAPTGHLKHGLEAGAWSVHSVKRTNPRNSWFAPVIKVAGKTTAEFQAFAKSLLKN